MCGVTALWDRKGRSPDIVARCAVMREALRHRGPDSHGAWADLEAGIALGHRRLAILDLSPAGAQPMASPSGRWKVAYNGEIYNFESLRSELPSQAWRGRSDTEVLCSALDRWGVAETLQRLRGMFALIAWDSVEDALWLARDRAGQKPLYWAEGSTVLVGSELRALQRDRACPDQVDLGAVADLVQWGHIRQPKTMLRGVRQLAPGCFARIPREGTARIERYWRVDTTGSRRPPLTSFGDAVEAVEAALTEAVGLRLVSDVPVGTLLSGGVDSSLITALALAHGTRIRTYTVGVPSPGYDESAAAAEIAAHLGTEHQTLELRTETLLQRVPDLAQVQDEPMGDSSLLPTWLVSELAREHVVVALGGDGGDELYGGYDRYRRAMAAYRWTRMTPSLGRAAGRRLLGGAERWTESASGGRAGRSARRWVRRSRQLSARDLQDLYATMLQTTPRPQGIVRGAGAVATLGRGPAWSGVVDLMAHDFEDYLPNDILVKTDRASMASSLELRAPFLDHRVVELAFSLPHEWTWGGGQGKRILKTILERHVPRPLWDRPKQGFAVPIDRWLRGPLRPWAESLLSVRALAGTGLWNVTAVRQRWDQHLAGQDQRELLWTVLQVQSWSRRSADAGGSRPTMLTSTP